MIRQLILSAVVATATLTGVTTSVEAAPAIPVAFDRGHDHDHDKRGRGRYEVLQRHRGHWDSVGVYRDRDDAQRVARQIERRGGDAKVQRLDGRR